MRKANLNGSRPETPVGLFTKAAELGAFSDLSPCEAAVFRAVLAKASAGGRAETCRDSVAAQVSCSVKTVSRALAVLQRRGLLIVKKTLTGFVTLIALDRLRDLARCVDLVRAKARDLLLSIKDMRLQFAQVIENLGKGHGVQSSGHGVPRSQSRQVDKPSCDVVAVDPVADYLATVAARMKMRRD